MHGGGNPIPVGSYGGLVTLADPTSIPQGASPRVYDMDYLVVQTQTRAGLRNAYLNANVTLGPNGGSLAISSTWTNPSNVLANDSTFTTQTPVDVANSLTVTGFSFSVPSTDTLTGILVNITGYSTAPANIRVQLTVNGIPIGSAKGAPMPEANSSFPLGSSSDLWNSVISGSDVNSLTFGVILTAITGGFSAATVLLDY